MRASRESSITDLTTIQRRAVERDGGPLLVLAGPGSGKTRVLTCRIARMLDGSRGKRFRILALTPTNAAAHVVATGVAKLAPGLEERATVVTFHGFCTKVLRQHGSHRGLRPDFAIYSQRADRLAVLGDALRRGGVHHTRDVTQLLPWIDHLKERLVEPEQAEPHLAAANGAIAEMASQVAAAYGLYEKELRRANALDVNSLILEAHRLFAYQAMAKFYQTVYRYWLVDDFQDTTGAQYELFRRMVASTFREIFVAADDDQTTSGWNGASVHRIRDLVRDYSCDVIQLPANVHCSQEVVEAANRLEVYGANRVPEKRPAPATIGPWASPNGAPIRCLAFATDAHEIAGVANEIAGLDAEARSGTAVLARRRAPLQAMHDALQKRDVPACLDLRGGDFASAEMRWLAACLAQVQRPLDRRNMAVLARSFEQFSEARADWGTIASRSESEGVTWLSAWIDSVRDAGTADAAPLVAPIAKLAAGAIAPAAAADQVRTYFENHDADDDLKEDQNAWHQVDREVGNGYGLARFLQEPGAVTLTAIHRNEGREFDTVYLIGLAEDILPSYRSIKREADNGEAAIDEERRECFAAITGARKRVILSRARRYRGCPKAPSRFLAEMGYLD